MMRFIKSRFSILRIIIYIAYIASVLIAVGGLIIGLMFLFQGVQSFSISGQLYEMDYRPQGLLFLIGSPLFGLVLAASGQFVSLLLHIEQYHRKQTQGLVQIAKTLEKITHDA